MARILERFGACAAAAALCLGVAVGVAVPARNAGAEPYLAVMSGLKCAQCHTNASGGGKRSVFGNAYAVNELVRRTVAPDGDAGLWTGEINRFLAAGADLRAGFEHVEAPQADNTSQFGVRRGSLYAELRPIPGLLSVYVDEQFAPGGTLNREAYAYITPQNGKYRIKAGKFFLPFGWRLQDDTAFVREASAVNMTTPDNGVEFGLELPRWSAQLALTNGTAGAADNDDGKQVSASAVYVTTRWRIGASYNVNDADLGDRDMQSVFAGIRTGRIAWLTEYSRVTDDLATGGERTIDVSLLEGNWRFAKGHNLKVTYEWMDPDDAGEEDERERYSLVWEHSPFQSLRSRIGWRAYNGVPEVAATNRDELFAELHVFF